MKQGDFGDETVAQISDTEWKEHHLTVLARALLGEKVWSHQLSVCIDFTVAGRPCLQIRHEQLPADVCLTIYEGGAGTVDAIESAVLGFFPDYAARELRRSRAAQRNAEIASGIPRGIVEAKCIAAITAHYPDGRGLKLTLQTNELYTFERSQETTIYVTWMSAHKAVTVARLEMSMCNWNGLKNGFGLQQREGIFWSELVRQFVTTKIPGSTPRMIFVVKINGRIKESAENDTVTRYYVDSATVIVHGTKYTVSLEENLPASLTQL